MAQVLSGTDTSVAVRARLKEIVGNLPANNAKPYLAVILVGTRKDSESYVRNKARACSEVGIDSEQINLDDSSTTEQILEHVNRLNADPKVNGILVQLPLPAHVNQEQVIQSIAPAKDADGLTIESSGRLASYGLKAPLIACTPLGCIGILDHYKIPISGKHAVVLGRSNLVGKPIAALLLARDATVTQCHSRTKDLPSMLKQADIIIAAIGKAEFVKGDWIKPGAVVIDVGINAVPDSTKKTGYRLVGDVHFESAKDVASAITPVPGGVGPMTVTMLLRNTVRAYASQTGITVDI